jgi:diamine N-acetyltransferase
MTISLRGLTRDTWQDSLDLQLSEEQSRFVAPNVYSLAEAQFYPGTVCRGVYASDTMVGFVMYGPDEGYAPKEERDGAYMVLRLMIDQRHHQGYGRAVLEEVIRRIRAEPGSRVIYLSTSPENQQADRLYRRLGFLPTGEVSDGEVVYRLDLSPELRLTR